MSAASSSDMQTAQFGAAEERRDLGFVFRGDDYGGFWSGIRRDLTAEQLGLIDKLQRSTVAEEWRISKKVAKQQESVADAEMVELSQANRAEDDGEGIIGRRIKSAIRVKEEGFQKVLQSADDLRLGTLKAVVGILSPIQAVHFLIAAGELHLSLHEWGRDKDERDTMQQST
ncbi:protein DELAY OF GERMINATION 1-like [Salvia miltiorrhiza]|uniref:protein DELAY OF GERMINATION 1-like n=1 Tax=Salvia miltiorrhiza TaxID=226208 RepID=UPI0025ACDDC9|nr:protein DELAY OF GERMINATION 1-like [Salvia miltiorrhiza]